MKEIEFRAFETDKARGRMFQWDEVKIDFSSYLNCNETIIMQYTGLKDKNEVKIFEGDIVKFIGGTCFKLNMNHYGKFYDIGSILKVSKLLSGFTLQSISADMDAPNLVGNISNYDLWNHQRSFEIIGNIHQNPELLTQ